MTRLKPHAPTYRSAIVVLSALALAAVALADLVAAAPAAQQSLPLGSAFGFKPGEERRYVLGPPESLAGGESAEWWIRYRGPHQDERGRLALFEFGHERMELIPGTWNPAAALMSVQVEGSMAVTMDGFPVEVRFEQRFAERGETMAADSKRRISFVWGEGNRYTKVLAYGTKDWDFKIGVPSYRNMEFEVPRGLFLWMPSALGCLGSSRSTCIERDPVFANPGFLSIAVPTLFEQIAPERADKVERQFMFFTPTAVGASPFIPITAGPWISRERDNFSNRERHFEIWKMKLGPSVDVQVGPRTMHAWELDMGGGIDRIYVEPDGGRVVRVDLESTMTNSNNRQIRLLFGFEEFLTPNEDPAERCCG